jgi:hypothetical protein
MERTLFLKIGLPAGGYYGGIPWVLLGWGMKEHKRNWLHLPKGRNCGEVESKKPASCLPVNVTRKGTTVYIIIILVPKSKRNAIR